MHVKAGLAGLAAIVSVTTGFVSSQVSHAHKGSASRAISTSPASHIPTHHASIFHNAPQRPQDCGITIKVMGMWQCFDKQSRTWISSPLPYVNQIPKTQEPVINIGKPGQPAISISRDGQTAIAIGGDSSSANKNGGKAFAISGNGGDAIAIGGDGGDSSNSTAGKGGDAVAIASN